MYRSPVVAHHYGSHRFLREIVSIQVLYVAESVRKRPRSAQKKVRDRSRTTVSVALSSVSVSVRASFACPLYPCLHMDDHAVNSWLPSHTPLKVLNDLLTPGAE